MPSTSRSRLSHNNRGDQNRSLNLKYSTRIRSFPQMGNSNQSDQHWKILENAIKEIQRKNNSNLSFEQLYRTSYTMVLHGSGQALYDGTKKAVETHLVKNIRPSIMASSENRFKHASDILKSWEDHRISMSMIKDILMYMDRNHCPKEKVPSTEIMGREVFRDQIISYTPIEKELRKHILERIAQSRLSESAQSSQTQIRDITSMLLILGSVSNTGNRDSSRVREVYEKIIEKPFLAQTSEFYGTV